MSKLLQITHWLVVGVGIDKGHFKEKKFRIKKKIKTCINEIVKAVNEQQGFFVDIRTLRVTMNFILSKMLIKFV